MSKPKSRIALITGHIETGKTTAVGRVVALARAQGYLCAGLWSPAHGVAGAKMGIVAADLSSGERRLLARMETGAASERIGRYTFDPDAFDWANRVLASAIAAQPDLLVVDEIGPLELERGGGLAPVLSPLAAGRVPRALIVVRAWLLDALRARLPGIPTAVFTVDMETRERTPEQVVSWLFETTG
jgi:nucleoside-triphosphatase THEP1